LLTQISLDTDKTFALNVRLTSSLQKQKRGS
jgi:hypothetical protein